MHPGRYRRRVELDWERLAAAVRPHVDAGVVPGVVMAAGWGDGMSEGTGEGTVDVRAVGDELGPDSVVRISSMTKPLVAVLALSLVEDGVLALDAPVDRWLPELADRQVVRRLDSPPEDTVPAERPITVDDVLTMRMGFGFVLDGDCPVLGLAARAGLGIGPPEPANPLTPDEWITRFARLPLLHQPGADWMYDLSYGVLGVLIARATGRPLDELLHERVLDPLGMRDTGFVARERLVPCYTLDDDGNRVLLDGVDDSRWAHRPAFPDPRGGLVSTAADYLRFTRMLLGHGPTLLRPASIAAMTSDRLGPERDTSASARVFLSGGGWGYGVEVITPTHGARVTRYGWGGGLGTTWYSFPDRDLAVVLLTQRLPPAEPLIAAFWDAVHQMIGA